MDENTTSDGSAPDVNHDVEPVATPDASSTSPAVLAPANCKGPAPIQVMLYDAEGLKEHAIFDPDQITAMIPNQIKAWIKIS